MADDDYGLLQEEFISNPDVGSVLGVRVEFEKSARIVSNTSVRSIREKTGLSQAKFAVLLGVSVRTLQDWEKERRAPSGAAKTLLLIADKNPGVRLEVA